MEQEIKKEKMPDDKSEVTGENDFSKETFKERVFNLLHPKGIQCEMLRYRPNSMAQNFCLFALCCVIAAFSTVYGYITTVDWKTGIDIIGGILMMLFSFLAATEMKAYSKKWSYGSFALAAFSIVRFFIYPFILHIADDSGNRILDNVRFTVVFILYVIAAACYVVAGVITIYRGDALRKYLSENKPIENEIIKR